VVIAAIFCCAKPQINTDFVKGPWTPKLTYHFSIRAQLSENFNSNIGTQRFFSMKKLTFDVYYYYHHYYYLIVTGWKTTMTSTVNTLLPR